MNNTAKYLLRGILPLGLILIVVLIGFGGLLANQTKLFKTESKLDGQIENAKNGKELGQLIVSNLGDVATLFYRVLVSSDPGTQIQLVTDVDQKIAFISNIADTLSHGGVVTVPLAEQLDSSYLITYTPDGQTQFKPDFTVLDSLLVDVQAQIHRTIDFTLIRNTALRTGQTEQLRQAGLKLRIFEAGVQEKLRQVRGQALQVVASATATLGNLTTAVHQAREESRRRDLLSTIGIFLVICGFIVIVLYQIRSAQRKLAKTVAELEEAQEELALSHSEILGLNESLEQQVEERTTDLTLAEQQWSDAFDAINSPLFIHDNKGRIIKANQSYLDHAGVSLDEAVGTVYWNLFPRRNMPMPGCLCKPHELKEKDTPRECMLEIGERIFRSQSFSVRNPEGEYLYGMHLMEDVSEQVSYRTELQASERRFRDLTDSLDVSLIMVDRNQQVLMLNQAARDCYNLHDLEYLGRPCLDIFSAHGIVCDKATVAQIFEDGKALSTQKKTRTGRIFEIKFHPIFDAHKQIIACTIETFDVSEREKYIKELLRYEQIIATSRDLVAFFDKECRYLAVNNEYAKYCGQTVESILGRHVSDVIGLDRYCHYLHYKDTVFEQRQAFVLTEWVEYPAYGRRYIELSIFPYLEADVVSGFVVRGRDLTEQHEQNARLRLSAKILENISEGILVTDRDGVIGAVNPAFSRITGYSEAEALGQKVNILKSGRHDDSFYRNLWSALNTSGYWRGEIWNRRKDGEIYPELLTINTIQDDEDQVNYVAVFSDISTVKKTSEKLEYLAHHNPLTGLPNRRLLQARLEHSLQYANREGTRGAVIYIDLDNFKKINDSLGHDAGDEVLKTVAQRLMEGARQVDTVAHLSGDEFVTVLHKIKSIDDAVIRANQILKCLQQPFQIKEYELLIGGSLGIAEYDGRSENIESLLKNADAAMYKAKEGGKNCYQVYSPELTEVAVEKVLIESHLSKALDRGELMLHYQPQVDMHSGRIVAAEALLRWVHPELGNIPPDKFIPLSEETGQIIPIGEWVLKTACQQMMQWRKQGLGLKRIAVNLSGKQIQLKNLHKQVEKVLYETGLPSGSLELEITEGFIMKHPEQSIAVLQSIRSLGVELSVDDFGTGHSSLNYLKRLPINRLKIDRAFVNDIGAEQEGEAITRAIIAMGRSLNLQITAEGVETAEQHEYLQAHGCHEAQGFLFSRPLSAQNMLELLQSDRMLILHAH